MTNEDLRSRLNIPSARLEAINAVLADPGMQVVNDFLSVLEKYGSPDEINAKAQAARDPAVSSRLSRSMSCMISVARL